MRNYRVQKIDPLDVALTFFLMAVVLVGIGGVIVCLGGFIQGYDWDVFLYLPRIVAIAAFLSMSTGFLLALAYNIVGYYTGGITLTLRRADEPRRMPHQNETNGPPTIGLPPDGTRDAE